MEDKKQCLGAQREDHNEKFAETIPKEALSDAVNANSSLDEKDSMRLVNKSHKKHVHRLDLTETEDFNTKLNRRGIVYLGTCI